MTAGGLIFRGQEVPVPGLTIWNPRNAAWAKLSTRDYRARRTSWVRQVIVHTTKGMWPQSVKPGAGPVDREKLVAHYWQQDPTQSAAQIVIGSDGEVACLADLATVCSFHAEMSNDWSVGIELYQERDGGVHEACYASALALIPRLCDLLEIPLQIPSDPYRNAPMPRMNVRGKTPGGPDMVGVFGHRDNTTTRGRGDPGDEIFRRLRSSAGADAWNYGKREDIARCRSAQLYLNEKHGAELSDDGVCGPKTFRAMKAAGYSRLSQVPALAA